MRQLGLAFQMYANQSNGYLPYEGYESGDAPSTPLGPWDDDSFWPNAVYRILGKSAGNLSYFEMQVLDNAGRRPLPGAGDTSWLICPAAGPALPGIAASETDGKGFFFFWGLEPGAKSLTAGKLKLRAYWCYIYNSGLTNPSGVLPSIAARTAVLINADGTKDTSTRLTSDYSFGASGANALRSVSTNNGTDIWFGGDNAGGDAGNNGGIRYVAKGGNKSYAVTAPYTFTSGATTTSYTGDNIRVAAVFGGYLYGGAGSDGAGTRGIGVYANSDSSLPKPTGDGQGLPRVVIHGSEQNTPGSSSLPNPPYARLTDLTMLDITGDGTMDVAYTATGSGNDIRKYIRTDTGTATSGWAYVGRLAVTNGLLGNTGTASTGVGTRQVAAEINPDGTISVYFVAGPADNSLNKLARVTDFTPAAPTFTTSGSTRVILTNPAGYTIGGIAVVPEPSSLGLLVPAVAMLSRRRR